MDTKKKLRSSLSNGQNEEGLTLVETLVALNVMMGCILFFSLALSQIYSVRSTISDDRQIEWHLFLNQLEYELRDKVLESVSSTGFSVNKVEKGVVQKESITFDINKNMYRRTINGHGHHPMLTKVKSFNVKQVNNKVQLQLSVTFENGESYTARIRVEVFNE